MSLPESEQYPDSCNLFMKKYDKNNNPDGKRHYRNIIYVLPQFKANDLDQRQLAVKGSSIRMLPRF